MMSRDTLASGSSSCACAWIPLFVELVKKGQKLYPRVLCHYHCLPLLMIDDALLYYGLYPLFPPNTTILLRSGVASGAHASSFPSPI
jgi:hypothetical protein